MPTNADLLLDTSAAMALLLDANPVHEAVTTETTGLILGLSGHALAETFSVLTRLPGQARVSLAQAQRLIRTEFPASAALSPKATLHSISLFADAGIAGGAVYDGLVGLAAKFAGIPLLSCDRRAAKTYTALQVNFRLI